VVTLEWDASRLSARVQAASAGGPALECRGRPRPAGGAADPRADALLISTSGTTGAPKLVRLSHGAIRHAMAAHLESFGQRAPFVALQALGVNYSYGLVASFLGTLWAGGTLVVPQRVDRAELLAAIAESEASVCLGTPALFRLLTEGATRGEREVLSRLQVAGVGGDHCPAHQRQALAAALPATRWFATYGLTEAGPRVSTLPAEHFVEKSDSVGLPLRGVELSVRDGNGRACPPGEIGLLHVRTPSIMSGYLSASREPPRGPAPDGWYLTGDLATLDAGGFLALRGRTDRQTKFRGRRLNPAAIERCLEAHPGVVSAHVEVDEAADRLVATVRVRSSFGEGAPAEIAAHCRRNLPNALVPQRIELVVDDGIYFKKRRVYGAPGT
jgi:acyl-CoA synthetase (AMP-forming)/AMP-acid ligase II